MNFKEFYEDTKKSDGTYVSADLSKQSANVLYEWCKLQNFCNEKELTTPDKYHITILFSRKEIPLNKQINLDVDIPASVKKYNLFSSDDDKCLVLELNCDELTVYHKQMIDAGGTHDFPDYIPHVTLAYKVSPDLDLDKLKLPDFKIDIKRIKSEPLDLNWKDKLEET